MTNTRESDERHSSSALADRECIPCRGGVPALRGEALEELQRELGGSWQVQNEHHLEKRYRFRNFADALAFVNRVGELAEQLNHHPDIELAWGRVVLRLWTHAIDGLSEADFIWAAKADRLAPS